MHHSFVGAFRSFGEKTASLFDRKKKDVEQVAAEKVQEAAHIVEDQVKKAGEEIGGAQNSATDATSVAAPTHSAIDALDKENGKEMSKVSLAAGEARDSANKAVADGKQVIDTTKDTINSTVDATKKAAESAKEQAAKAAEDAKEKARAAAEAAQEEAKRVANAAVEESKKAAEKAAADASNALSSMVDNTLKRVEGAADEGIKNASGVVDNKLKDADKYLNEKRENIDATAQVLSKLIAGLASATHDASESAAGFLSKGLATFPK